jgi:adenosylmethionine-8-amino-7-oxononanoate aminotransferase
MRRYSWSPRQSSRMVPVNDARTAAVPESNAPPRAGAAVEAPAWLQQDLRLELPEAVRGEGIWLWDADGRAYIDACSGAISVVSVGHGVLEVADAIREQAGKLAYVHSTQFRNTRGAELAETIAAHAPGSLNHACFYSGGSEAIEAAIKLARHYHLLRGKSSKYRVLSRRRSYHGATLYALGVGGVPARQEPYRPYLVETPKQVECYPYRCPFGADHPCCDLACADDLGRVLAEVDADTVSCYLAEPIVAAAGPGLTPPPGYYERVLEICRANDILFVSDEIVTGWGRTGRTFGIEHWDAEPDLIVTAKGLAGGYLPLSAVIFSDEIGAAFAEARTPFVHNLTYEAHPVAAAAALAVVGIIDRDGLVENARRRGERLFGRLHALAGAEPLIGDVRGKGLLAAVELVADRTTKRPLDPGLSAAKRLQRLARDRGLMIYPGAGGDGTAGDQVLVSPPLVVTDDEVDLIVDRFSLALADLRSEVPA